MDLCWQGRYPLKMAGLAKGYSPLRQGSPFAWLCFQADRQQLALMHPALWFHESWSSGIKLSFPCLQPTTNNTPNKQWNLKQLTSCLGCLESNCSILDRFVSIDNFRKELKEQWPSPWIALSTFLPVLRVHYDGSRWVKGFGDELQAPL